jgi:hypothetical protein
LGLGGITTFFFIVYYILCDWHIQGLRQNGQIIQESQNGLLKPENIMLQMFEAS